MYMFLMVQDSNAKKIVSLCRRDFGCWRTPAPQLLQLSVSAWIPLPHWDEQRSFHRFPSGVFVVNAVDCFHVSAHSVHHMLLSCFSALLWMSFCHARPMNQFLSLLLPITWVLRRALLQLICFEMCHLQWRIGWHSWWGCVMCAWVCLCVVSVATFSGWTLYLNFVLDDFELYVAQSNLIYTPCAQSAHDAEVHHPWAIGEQLVQHESHHGVWAFATMGHGFD